MVRLDQPPAEPDRDRKKQQSVDPERDQIVLDDGPVVQRARRPHQLHRGEEQTEATKDDRPVEVAHHAAGWLSQKAYRPGGQNVAAALTRPASPRISASKCPCRSNPFCPSATSPCASGALSRSTASRSTWPTARSSGSSAPTAPGRRRSSIA